MALLETVSVLATISLIVLQLGSAPAVLEILQTRSTGVTPLVPLVALGTSGWMWTMYGYLGGNIFPSHPVVFAPDTVEESLDAASTALLHGVEGHVVVPLKPQTERNAYGATNV